MSEHAHCPGPLVQRRGGTVLFLIGVTAFKRGGRLAHAISGEWHRRGLMLLSLHILLDTRRRGERAAFAAALAPSPVSPSCLLMASALTWAAHSSVDSSSVGDVLGLLAVHQPVAALALILAPTRQRDSTPCGGSHSDNPASPACPGHLLNGRRLPLCAVPDPIVRASLTSSPIPRVWPPISYRIQCARASCLFCRCVARIRVDTVAAGSPKPADPSTPLYLDETVLGSFGRLGLRCTRNPSYRRHH